MMNKKILNIIASLVLLLAFFMPWIKAFGFGGSPYQILSSIIENIEHIGKNLEALYYLVLLVFPLSAIVILTIYLGKGISSSQVVKLRVFKRAPFMILMVGIIYGLIKSGDFAKVILENISDFIGIGFVLTFISALVLIIDQPKMQSFDGDSENKSNENLIKETANTDDLFN